MAVAIKPIVGYTHKISEGGATWLELVGTNTRYDGHKVAYPDKGDVAGQIERAMRIINLGRACQMVAVDNRPLACRYESQVIGGAGWL